MINVRKLHDELRKILELNDPAPALESFLNSGSLQLLSPDLYQIVGFGGKNEGHKDLWEHTKFVVAQSPNRLCVRYAALFHDVGKPFVFRKHGNKVTFYGHENFSAEKFQCFSKGCDFLSSDQASYISSLIILLGDIESYENSWSDAAIRRLRKKFVSEKQWHDVICLSLADITTKHNFIKKRIHHNVDDLEARVKYIETNDELSKPVLPKGFGNIVINEFGVLGKDIKQYIDFVSCAIRKGEIKKDLDQKIYIQFLKQKFHEK